MIAAFCDHTHPQSSVERIVGFRKLSKGSKEEEDVSIETE